MESNTAVTQQGRRRILQADASRRQNSRPDIAGLRAMYPSFSLIPTASYLCWLSVCLSRPRNIATRFYAPTDHLLAHAFTWNADCTSEAAQAHRSIHSKLLSHRVVLRRPVVLEQTAVAQSGGGHRAGWPEMVGALAIRAAESEGLEKQSEGPKSKGA